MRRVAQLLLLLCTSQCNAETCNGAVTELKFDANSGAALTSNNFGNRLLDASKPFEGRVHKAGQYDGQDIDVVLQSYEGGFNDPDCYDGGNTTWKGKDGNMGNFDCKMQLAPTAGIMNFYLGKHDAHPMKIMFEYSDGTGPATLPIVDLTLWDTGAAEFFKIAKDSFDAYGCGIEEDNDDCTLVVEDDTIVGNSTANGVKVMPALKFTATKNNIPDVPDLMNPSAFAAENAVRFRIKDASEVIIELGRGAGGGGAIALSGVTGVGKIPCDPGPVVHGDPMFKVNGKGAHFWLRSGSLQPLLVWPSPKGMMKLFGRTFDNEKTKSQWFDKFVIEQDGKDVLDVTARLENGRSMRVRVDGEEFDRKDATGSEVDVRNFPEKGLKLWSSNRVEKHNIQRGTPAEKLSIEASGVGVTFYSSKAHKLPGKLQQARMQHLNLRFDGPIPKGASGLFAELGGTKKMTSATQALLVQPPATKKPARKAIGKASAAALLATLQAKK